MSLSYTRVPSSPSPHPMKSFFSKPTNSSNKPRVTPTRRRKLLFSYAPDWIITVILAALFFSLDKVNGYRRVFSLTDTSLRHPYAIHERVPNIALFMICFVAPLVLQPIVNLLTVRSWWDLHNSTLGLVLGLALTGAFTQFAKITVGRPRPDVIDRCQPPAGSVDPTFGLTSWTICTQTNEAIMRDGWRSFPSGHSSLSFAGLGFFAFYLAGKLHLFDSRGHAGKSWLALGPFAAAALVAISRTMDYRHHWHDVLIGSLLGTTLSYFSYRQYYPSLASELSHRPYSPRIKREDEDEDEDNVLPTHSHSASIGESHPFVLPYPIGSGKNDTLGGSHDYELDGTVLRPDPGPLEEVWEDGHGHVSEEVKHETSLTRGV